MAPRMPPPGLCATFEKRTSVKPLNQCAVCGEDFASLAAFDEHVLSQAAEPTFDCLQGPRQLEQAGWMQDTRGRWTSPNLMQ